MVNWRPLFFGARFSCAGLLCLFLGCVSDQDSKKPSVTSFFGGGGPAIDEINLLAVPVALNLDGIPGLDGFVIKIYASNRERPKPVPIEAGSVEVLMYNGIPGVTENASQKPQRTWTYKASELKQFEINTSIGTGYQVAPIWGAEKPAGNKISVIVRYIPSQGKTITSAPSIISVALK